jgi:hypothetical protein
MTVKFEFVTVILLTLLALAIYQMIYNENKIFIKSNKDGREYEVRNIKGKQKAADLLCKIRKRLIRFCIYLKDKYGGKSNIKRLLKNFNPNNIKEGDSDLRFTSYSVNKGEEMVLCLRSRNPRDYDELHNMNLLMYVSLHELSHMCSEQLHHTDEFHRNFKFLLKEAKIGGFYKPNETPQEYCGLKIYE